MRTWRHDISIPRASRLKKQSTRVLPPRLLLDVVVCALQRELLAPIACAIPLNFILSTFDLFISQ